jgi:hypothetical protein
MSDDQRPPLPREAVTFLAAGKFIDAIKSVRSSHGLGLSDAKAWVDSHIAKNPAQFAQLLEDQRAMRRKVFFWFLVVDALIIGGVVYWFVFKGAA